MDRDVRGCPSAHTESLWLSISTHISTLFLGLSTLALPVDCSGGFGPRGLSVQYTQDVSGCPPAHTGRPWLSVGVLQDTQDVRGCPSAHTERPWTVHQYTYQHAGPFRGLSISTHISTLALPVDCSGDFGPRGLSVQYTQDVRGCPSAHTGRPWVSVSTHRTSLGVCQYTQDVRGCPCVSISTHRTSVAVHQHTQNFCGCPSVHISARCTQTTSVGDRQHPQGVCGCSLAHTRRPWTVHHTHMTSVGVRQHTQDVHGCPSGHTRHPWTVHQYTYQHAGPSRGQFGTSVAVRQQSQYVRGLSISTHISTLALPMDCSDDFGPLGLSVQYTQDIRGCPWVSVSTHKTSVAVLQHTQDIR
ncbi:hypothetical protein YC2023_019562 [Brassica napus]